MPHFAAEGRIFYMMSYIFVIIGFVLLIKGADCFVDGCVSVARRFHIPSMVIGLTIVAFGTSAPEAAVSIAASVHGSAGIAVGNIVGSNLFNLLIVCGGSVIFAGMQIKKETITRDYPIYLAAAVLLYIFCTALVGQDKIISRIDGAVLLAGIVAYVTMLVHSVMRGKADSDADNYECMPVFRSILFIALGLAAVVVGGDIVVEGASDIARRFGLSDSIIGMTIVAIGTSLPELVTSFAAIRKGEQDIALGNVIGSNIFNILFVIGAAAVVNPIEVDANAVNDMLISIIISIAVYAMCLHKRELRRGKGIAMVLIYAAFFTYVFMRHYGIV